jgi:hypothetical protein
MREQATSTDIRISAIYQHLTCGVRSGCFHSNSSFYLFVCTLVHPGSDDLDRGTP